MNYSDYQSVTRKSCVILMDLAYAAFQSGDQLGEPVSFGEATDALVRSYHGDEMLYDGTCTGFLEPYSESLTWSDEDELSKIMVDAVMELFNTNCWEASTSSHKSISFRKTINLHILKNEVAQLWLRQCSMLFKGKTCDFETYSPNRPIYSRFSQGLRTRPS